MPAIIRKRCGFQTHPWHRRFHASRAILGASALAPGVALAQERPAIRPVADYFDAFTALSGHEIAVLALSLGVILFAVTTAISLLRTRTRAALTLTAKQSEINDLRDETYFASLEIRQNGSTREVDARPSDAVALAVRGTVPIFVEEFVIDRTNKAPDFTKL